MKRRVLGTALLAAAVWLTAGDALGFGGRKKKDCATPCATGVVGGYGDCGTGHAAGSYQVSYVDQKVSGFKTEWETKDVKVTVSEWKMVTEEFKYIAHEPETKKEKRTFKEMKTKDEPFKYTVNEWTKVKEKVKTPETKAVTKDVEVTTYEYKPTVTKQKRTVCDWVCVPGTVTYAVAPTHTGGCDTGRRGLFGGLCGKKKNDCGPCPPAPCEPCGPAMMTATVMQRQMITREVEMDVTTYEKIEKKGMQKVTSYETNWVEKEVDVMKCMPVEKTGTHKVCFWVDVEKEVDVTTYKPVEKTGTRNVWKGVPVEKMVKQSFAKQVPYETTIKVPVYTWVPAPMPAPAPAPAPGPVMGDCDTVHYAPIAAGMGGGCGKPARGGLFRGCCK